MSAAAPDAVLAGIPGWRGASWRSLDGGTGSRTYLVARRGRRAVLKIDAGPRTAPLNTRAAEARIQARAHEAGLGNRVLYHDATSYLCEYADGNVWQSADFGDARRLQALADALRRLHALPCTGRRFDGIAAARGYASGLTDESARNAGRHLVVIESMPPPETVCFCHNDLVAGNILLLPQVRFIDWEYAADNDPYFDLATIVAEHSLPESLSARFLDAYCGGAGSAERDRLAAYCRYYRALCWLWERAQS